MRSLGNGKTPVPTTRATVPPPPTCADTASACPEFAPGTAINPDRPDPQPPQTFAESSHSVENMASRSCRSSWSAEGRQTVALCLGLDLVVSRQTRPAGHSARRGQVQHLQIAGCAINLWRPSKSQPQGPTTFAILQLQVNDFRVFDFHNCLFSFQLSAIGHQPSWLSVLGWRLRVDS